MCMPVVFWSTFSVDLTNHGLRRTAPSNPVDPIQPQIKELRRYYGTFRIIHAMCRLLGLIGKPPLPVREALETFYPLCKKGHVKCIMEPGHLDGWGVSGFNGGRAVYFDRCADAADHDEARFKAAAAKAGKSNSPIVIAHLRKASMGDRDIANTHPFHARDWVFAHNGTVFGAMASLPITDGRLQGATDSERLMFWILEHVAHETDVTTALAELLKNTREKLVYSSLTFLLSDGKSLWAYRDFGDKRLEKGETVQEREKYYTLYTAKLEHGTIVCSEPLEAVAKSWKPMAQRTLLAFKI